MNKNMVKIIHLGPGEKIICEYWLPKNEANHLADKLEEAGVAEAIRIPPTRTTNEPGSSA